MRSAYPSSQSFFDATSDSIRVEDVVKCRNSSSFSSLADLFTNSSCKSDLFPNFRVPVFVPEEVRFPAKKKRECEERTSIWHEWGSGECQTENVAQESSGFSSDFVRPLEGKSSALASSSFPNLGSANISLVTEDFTFPPRKNRGEGISWREERTSWQDWCTSGASTESTVTGSTSRVGSIADMYSSQPCTKPCELFADYNPSPFSSLGAPARIASEEVCFPARKKREERRFWQECSLDGAQSESEFLFTPRSCTPGVGSLSEMYLRKAGSKCSSLFSSGVIGSTEEVVFPTRKNHVNRNAWRDWTNTGYLDYDEDAAQNGFGTENSFCSPSVTKEVGLSAQVDVLPRIAPSGVEGPTRLTEGFWIMEKFFEPECDSRLSRLPRCGNAVNLILLSSQIGREQVIELVSGLRFRAVGKSDAPRSLLYLVNSGMERSPCAVTSEVERTLVGGESSDALGIVQISRSSKSEGDRKSSGRFSSYPPPLGSLSRQGPRVPHHMPWVQLQPIRSEGRFVLKEVKVTQPVVFHSIRKEGRLVLQLIGQEGNFRNGEVIPRFFGNCSCSEHKVLLASGNTNVSASGTASPEGKVAVEKLDLWQPPEHVAFAGTKGRKKSEFWPSFCNSRQLDRDEVSLSREEASADRYYRNWLNLMDRCDSGEGLVSYRPLSESDRLLGSKPGFSQDIPPLWILGKLLSEERRHNTSGWLSEIGYFRDRFAVSSEVAERLSQRETLPHCAHFQTVPANPCFGIGLASLKCSCVDVGTETQDNSISSLFDFGTENCGKEDEFLESGGGLASEVRPLSVCQGIVCVNVVSLATAHSLVRSLTTRPDISGGTDSGLSNYKHSVAAAFSCADGMGKPHHKSNFWEQQPCVS